MKGVRQLGMEYFVARRGFHCWQSPSDYLKPIGLLIFLLIANCTYCSSEKDLAKDSCSKSKKVVLYVSNQSRARPKVDLLLEIDGVLVVDNEFTIGNAHNYQSYPIMICPG